MYFVTLDLRIKIIHVFFLCCTFFFFVVVVVVVVVVAVAVAYNSCGDSICQILITIFKSVV